MTDVAATISTQPPSRRNGGSDPTAGQFVFGGNNSGEIKQAAAHETGQGFWQDGDVDGVLRAEGENRPSRPSNIVVTGPLAAHSPRHGHAMTTQQAVDAAQIIPFDTTQLTSWANYSSPKPGDPSHPLAANADAPAIVFNWQSGGDNRINPSETGVDALQANQTPAVLAFAWQQGDDSKFNPSGRGRSWVARAGDYTGALSGNRQDAVSGNKGVRRLTPTEAERLQGFPDGWTRYYQKSVQCDIIGAWLKHFARLKDVIDQSLIGSAASASCTISVSQDMEVSICRSDTTQRLSDAVPVIGWLGKVERVVFAPGTTNLGSGMVILYSPNGTPRNAPPILSVGEGTTVLLLNLLLDAPYSAGKLSIISTWMQQITPLLISMSATTPPSTVAYTLHWNEPRPHSFGEDYWYLRTANIDKASDSARYRQLGNAVAIPCVEWIGRRIVACVLERQGHSGA